MPHVTSSALRVRFHVFLALVATAVGQISDFEITAGGQIEGESGDTYVRRQKHKAPRKVDTFEPAESNVFEHPPWISSCKSIYLDVGSNIGVQIHKFYEPQNYPGAPVLPLFDGTFGQALARTKATDVCCLGLEPNPNHWEHLQTVKATAQNHGWHVHFYPFAAWKADGTVRFAVDENAGTPALGASVTVDSDKSVHVHEQRHRNSSYTSVRSIDLAAFVKSLPPRSVKLMKMDIEGSEYETVTKMIQERVLCKGVVDSAFMEVHNFGDITTWQDDRTYEALQRRIKNTDCGVDSLPSTLVPMDDETYMFDKGGKWSHR